MALALIRRARHLLLGAALVAAGLPAAHAQGLGLFGHRQQACPAPCPCPCPVVPETKPETQKDPPDKKDPVKEVLPAPVAPIDPTLQPVTSAALGDSFVSLRNDAGYIDNALPVSHVRLRYDNANFANRPDRAEFFYAKCGCFREAGVDPNARGPIEKENAVDYQDITTYIEVAKYGVFSGFVELPVRFLNPDNNSNTRGIADMNAGFKAALLRGEYGIVTFQFRTYIPTGDSDLGLGTRHVSLEPSILFARSVTDQLLVFGQVGDWIPVGGTDFAGNVLRYGVGASWLAVERCNWRMAPVAEVLGWTVLDGKSSDVNAVTRDASGDTIVNGKFGVRFGFGPLDNMAGLLGNSDLYIGYGRALTGEVWYKDIFRIEYRMAF